MSFNIIIIDDHTLFREGLQSLLKTHHINVLASVNNGKDGINEVFSKEPDIVLLDLRMPDLSGIDVLKKMGRPIMEIKEMKKEESVVCSLTGSPSDYNEDY